MHRWTALGLFVASAIAGTAQNYRVDLSADVAVTRPRFEAGEGPRVLYDEAHHNTHRLDSTFEPFRRLLRNDGYSVHVNREPFRSSMLRRYRVVIIVGAWGSSEPHLAHREAFAAEEREMLVRWVRDGGGLLLVTDHYPTASASMQIAREFGIDVTPGRTIDPLVHVMYDQWLRFARSSGSLLTHPVTEGSGPSERVDVVNTYAGTSLKGPGDAAHFMAVSASAVDYLQERTGQPRKEMKTRSAAGRAQGIAMSYGRGRVVCLGEAGMLTAQIGGIEGNVVRTGLGDPNADNRQLTLNILHWLSGVLD